MNYSNGLSHLQGKLLKTTLVWMKCPNQVCKVRTCIRMSGLITVPIHQCLPHPWISGVLDSWPWKQMILLALIITQSTNPSSSSACSAHPVDTCSWCTMLQRWGNICSHGFCKEGKYQLEQNVHGIMGTSPGTTLKQVLAVSTFSRVLHMSHCPAKLGMQKQRLPVSFPFLRRLN